MAGAAIGEIMQLWERRLATLTPLKLEESEHVAERLGGQEFSALKIVKQPEQKIANFENCQGMCET